MEDSRLPSSPLQRPGTGGVKVTEHPAGKINPAPLSIDETEFLIEEYLSPRKLRALTGIDNLEDVKYLEMKVDTSETSLGNFGALLPNLTQLKLSNSIIFSVRDLGSSFAVLRVLWMARCNLEDLDGVTAMSSLRELYLAYNAITDLSPLSMMENLEILDLEGNNISEVSQVEFLSLCTNLVNITLEGNPICVTPHPELTSQGYDYRTAVKKCIRNIKILDDEPLVSMEVQSRTNAGFESDWNFLMELEKDGTIGSLDSIDEGGPLVASSQPIRPTTGYRPGTALKPTSAMKRLGTARIIGTAAARPKTANRPLSSDSGTCDPVGDASELTTGELVCGNPSKALRLRKKRSPIVPDIGAKMLFAKYKHTPEHSYANQTSQSDDGTDLLLEELKEWRVQHEQVHQKIEESRAPNILTIDHDEAVDGSLSTSDCEPELDREDDEDQGFVSRQDNQPSDDEPQSPHTTNTIVVPESPRTQSKEIAVDMRKRRYKPVLPPPRAVVGGPSNPLRPISGPPPRTLFSLPLGKAEENLLANGQPVIIRAEIRSPEKPTIDRASRTANAAVFRRMPQLAALPSKRSVPK